MPSLRFGLRANASGASAGLILAAPNSAVPDGNGGAGKCCWRTKQKGASQALMRKHKQEIYDERRQQIIEGALKVFSAKGFIEATNKEIAEAAGINSAGLIYHYFASKEDLLRAIIEQYSPALQLVARAEAMRALPLEEALRQFGRAYLRVMDDPQIGGFMRLLLGEALRSPEIARVFGEVGPLRVLQLLADYLRGKMDEGLLRRADPMIAARCFIGPLVTCVLARSILGLDRLAVDPATFVTTSVDIFLRGLRSE
jgi:AcrR family transcriptional regulator